MPILEIFSQGEEIVTGQTVDTNAAWLSEQAVQLGFTVARHTAVGDKLGDLIGLLKEISERADCCLCTGGLGPTSDDLTAEAVAKAFGLPLAFDEIAYRQIQAYFSNRQRPMPEVNRKQALLPQGSIRLDNDWGTAPGFALQAGRCWFAFMPGVPSEMRNIFLERVKPLLPDRFVLTPSRLVTIKTVGIGESDIQQRLDGLQIPPSVQLGFRAGIDEVQTKLLFPADYPAEETAALTYTIAERLSSRFVFGIDGLTEKVGSLAAVVDKLMCETGAALAVVETVNQGLLSAKCMGSAWLKIAVFERSPSALCERFGTAVDENDLSKTGARLAKALQDQRAADFVLVQLHEGSQSQFRDKDRTIILYNTLLTENSFQQSRHILAGPIERKQNQAALFGLDLLRRHLQDNR
ncbi:MULTISPECIES: competence/damage-inducible protein A [Methylomicrobium]|uniref:Molybdenum cofactor synthesis domain protein n=1 Tax=Methylomicrobium album BG8 TaxID=686340 RepID=H8GKQ4_METAL|nr:MULTISPECIES: molybdopterin-binding protein [Methylomicrobium]EIC28062.1 molybdenum cofactor synthesis domain protein [Methylomicrobium album BG8]